MVPMARSLAAALLLSLTVGCEPNPCNDYVDYMCACHDQDPGVDCQALRNTYANADSALQDSCARALDDQQAVDDNDTGLVCDNSTP